MSEAAVHIGELSERTGASRRSLRYYEQRGLIHARRTESGWREYDEGAVARVRRVRDLLRAGMTVEDIRQLTPCLDNDGLPSCVDPSPAVAVHQARLAEVDARIERLRRYREELLRRIAWMRDATSRVGGQEEER